MCRKHKDMEKMLPKTGKYEFMAEPFHCDFSNRLFMGHLGNAMLNAADFHSNDRGYGMSYLNGLHKTWVLSRLAIEMEEMPTAYDRFSVETWVESAMKFFTSRNFAVTGPDGRTLGYGRSIWAMIDTETRQPVDLLAVRDGLINAYVERDKACPISKPSRVRMDKEAPLVHSLDTYYNDIDVNGHVNSVKYIEHVLDLFDLPWYRLHRLQRFEIAYVAESHQGDRLHFYREQTGEDEYGVRITKGTDDEVEVVRSLIRFAKD
ncbi:acyl-ACP thioesterase [Prevotella dentalis DSM 3688]|uniref:Acyl-ACP thioesterase n=2 Tax=Prevotella dentalis (strain ATCC 49559 / DSM 3688 / JCM 13448 / NCTC 12043 / ES 2772) TaxID=908937 RepID=F9D1E1_PREDD|nr:acyl-ACP thioesterase [Prevotella dentalis DSM 3688]